jgi:hypothetical protein
MKAVATLTGPHERAPRWAVAAGGLLVALLMLELLLRVEGPRVCLDSASAELLSADPDVGWTFTPGATFRAGACDPHAVGESWAATVTVNQEGLADQEWPYEKRPGEVRVLVLGDERVDGVGLARADRLSVRLSHLADRVRGARVSGINGAIPGYGLLEKLRWLERRGLRYSPDVVLLVLDPLRDLAAAPALRPAVPPTLPPASGLLAWSAVGRWLGSGPSDDTSPATSGSPTSQADGAAAAASEGAQTKLLAAIADLAKASRDAGAEFAVLVAPPCPPSRYDASLCDVISKVAPCTDPLSSFEDVRSARGAAAELCVAGTGRWGRDAHFLASHQVWSLFDREGLWPASVRRGHRL